MIKIEFLREPTLEFGEYFEHEDSKTGLAEFGPFGKNVKGLHKSEITLGFVGTAETVTGAKEWITECDSFIESENIKLIKPPRIDENDCKLFAQEQDTTVVKRLHKILNRDFEGFSRGTRWASEFQMNQRWEKELRPADLTPLLKIEDKEDRIKQLVALFDDEIKRLAKASPAPDIIVVALTEGIETEADSVRLEGNFYLNFRRALKAQAMKWGKPIQILRQSTIVGTRKELQEKATRAWNFCTAMYYKADGVPWRLIGLPQDTCFIGIDFYLAPTVDGKTAMRSSVSQAFDHLGQGVVLRGDPFEWNEDDLGKSPHMTTMAASKLIRMTLDEYVRVRETPPRRVVIHKSSSFWGKEHVQHNELDGMYEGIYAVAPRCHTDSITLRQSGVRLFREGAYPPARGTYFTKGDRHFAYMMGYIPYLETYPGTYVPEPWEIVEHHGGSSQKELLREVLALTKMNVNNCSYADGTPITTSFSHKVGEVMKHIPPGEEAQTGYKFYM